MFYSEFSHLQDEVPEHYVDYVNFSRYGHPKRHEIFMKSTGDLIHMSRAFLEWINENTPDARIEYNAYYGEGKVWFPDKKSAVLYSLRWE